MADYKQRAVLYVDDELHSLKYFDKILSRDFRILTAPTAKDGWALLDHGADDIAVLLTDQRMPGETGVQLLEKVRQEFPGIIRILVTAYADLDSAIEAVNSGAIYKYISKPWDINELRVTLMRAIDYFQIQRERNGLIAEKLSTIQRILGANHLQNLTILSAGLGIALRNSLPAFEDYLGNIPANVPELLAREAERMDISRWSRTQGDSLAYILCQLCQSIDQTAADPSATPPLGIELDGLLSGRAFVTGNKVDYRLDLPADLRELRCGNGIARICELMIHTLWVLSAPGAKITVGIRQESADVGGSIVKLVFDNGEGDWNAEQRPSLYRPSLSRDGVEYHPGLDLLVGYLLSYNADGRVEIKGKQGAKMVVSLPVATGRAVERVDTIEAGLLADLLIRSVEMYSETK